MLNVVVPFPVPAEPAVTAIQLAPLVAVHVQPAAAVTAMLLLADCAPAEMLVGDAV